MSFLPVGRGEGSCSGGGRGRAGCVLYHGDDRSVSNVLSTRTGATSEAEGKRRTRG